MIRLRMIFIFFLRMSLCFNRGCKIPTETYIIYICIAKMFNDNGTGNPPALQTSHLTVSKPCGGSFTVTISFFFHAPYWCLKQTAARGLLLVSRCQAHRQGFLDIDSLVFGFWCVQQDHGSVRWDRLFQKGALWCYKNIVIRFSHFI